MSRSYLFQLAKCLINSLFAMAMIPYAYGTDPKAKDGQSYTRFPLFDGTDYNYWKQRMSIHLKGIDVGLWKIVMNGFTLNEPTITVPLTSLQITENEKLESLDANAMSILYCGQVKTEFNRISSCTTNCEAILYFIKRISCLECITYWVICIFYTIINAKPIYWAYIFKWCIIPLLKHKMMYIIISSCRSRSPDQFGLLICRICSSDGQDMKRTRLEQIMVCTKAIKTKSYKELNQDWTKPAPKPTLDRTRSIWSHQIRIIRHDLTRLGRVQALRRSQTGSGLPSNLERPRLSERLRSALLKRTVMAISWPHDVNEWPW